MRAVPLPMERLLVVIRDANRATTALMGLALTATNTRHLDYRPISAYTFLNIATPMGGIESLIEWARPWASTSSATNPMPFPTFVPP